jgi:hypothetical protein
VNHKRHAVESFKSPAEDIGPIEAGMSRFLISRGQWSMIDAVLHCLDYVKPAHMSVWTWHVAVSNIEVIEPLLCSDRLLSATLILDRSGDTRNNATGPMWRERFGNESIRICRNHAKIVRLWNDEFRLLLRGSLNMNRNPRFEQLDVTEGGEDFDLVAQVESELPILPPKYSNAEVDAATGVSRAWEYKQLAMFREIKTWAK